LLRPAGRVHLVVLKLRVEAPDGWARAKCKGMAINGDDPWFEDEPTAMEFCNEHGVCPIREQCLLFALVNNCKEGVWGGTSELDRKAIRKQWPLRGGRVPRPEWTWFPPGEPAQWYDPAILRAELDGEEDDDDE